MSTTKVNPPGGDTKGISNVLPGGSNGSILPEDRSTLIGSTVEAQLDGALWKLIRGDAELYDLTPALAAWWTLAHEYGCRSRDAEVAQLAADRDAYYERWMNPGKKLTEARERRMNEAAEHYWNELVTNAQAVAL